MNMANQPKDLAASLVCIGQDMVNLANGVMELVKTLIDLADEDAAIQPQVAAIQPQVAAIPPQVAAIQPQDAAIQPQVPVCARAGCLRPRQVPCHGRPRSYCGKCNSHATRMSRRSNTAHRFSNKCAKPFARVAKATL
jgi:hypothetical protein